MSMFPIRVLVESVRPQHCLTCSREGNLLADSYAVVSGATLLSQLVDTVLSALGMPQLALHSRGLVQVSNWKPLSFEQITDNIDDTVETILKGISHHITLKILTKQSATDLSSSQCISELRQRLLKTAVSKQPQILSTVDNEEIKQLILQVVSGEDPSSLNFNQIRAINEWLEQIDDGTWNKKSSLYPNRFNQLLEIPKLERWFRSDQSPSRQKLINFMNLLNGSNYRKHNAKITYQQICNWFANQRAISRSATQFNHTNISTPVASMVPSNQPSLSIDFHPKFDFNTLNDCKQLNGVSDVEEIQRIDGGSDSPTPNDDASVHSTSDGGFDHEALQKQTAQELGTSSPELSLELNGSLASTSPKPILNASILNGNGANSQPPVGTVARSRLMFDPLTELPVLEKWFEENPHPTWIQIDQYTEALNSCQYRQSYPPISTHNVKIWFKNRRAKCKRMLTGEMKTDKCF